MSKSSLDRAFLKREILSPSGEHNAASYENNFFNSPFQFADLLIGGNFQPDKYLPAPPVRLPAAVTKATFKALEPKVHNSNPFTLVFLDEFWREKHSHKKCAYCQVSTIILLIAFQNALIGVKFD